MSTQLSEIFKGYRSILTLVIGIIVIGVGITIIIGWIFKISSFTHFLITNRMWTNMGICFVFSGIAFVLAQLKNTHHGFRKIAQLASIMVILISGLTFCEYLSGLNLGLDQIFIKNYSTILHPGRMVMLTAINFLFIGMSLLFLSKNSNPWIFQILAWIVFSFALFSFLNHINQADIDKYYIIQSTTMDLSTTTLFMLLSIGVLLVRYNEGLIDLALENNPLGYVMCFILPIILIVPVLVTLLADHGIVLGMWEERYSDSITGFGTYIIMSMVIVIMVKLAARERTIHTKKLERSESTFREFAEKIEEVFYRTSLDLNTIDYVSPAFTKVWGLSIDALYKNPLIWFESIVPEDRKIVTEAFIHKIKYTPSVAVEFRIKRPDGTIRNILSKGFQIKDIHNQVTGIIGVAIDITASKKAKKENDAELHSISILEGGNNINEVAPPILKIICEMFEWEVGEIWLVDSEKKVLRCIGNWYEPAIALEKFQNINQKITFERGEGMPGKVWEKMQIINFADYPNLPEYLRSSVAGIAGLQSAFGVPIIYKNKILGVLDFFSLRKKKPDDDLINFLRTINRLLAEFIQRKHSEEQLISISRHDSLTGLLSRSAFEEDVNILSRDERSQRIAVIILDISRFKLINESIGHKNTGILLKTIAQRLKETINFEKSNIARLDADTFIIYYSKFKFSEEAKNYARGIQLAFKEPFVINKERTILSLNMGIAIYPKDGSDAASLMHHANLALTHAKSMGEKNIQFYSKALPEIATKQIAMENDLRLALIENQFVLYFQPQVDLKTGGICGAEVLIRWQHPTKGLLPASNFIPFAEENNLMNSINEYMLRAVFRMIDLSWSGSPLSVNISPKQFGDQFHFIEFIEQLITEFKTSPKYIELEVTESFLMEDVKHNLAVLAALHKLGFNIAIDDFGTGYSLFSYLHSIPANKMKIDISFIKGLPANKTNALIVKSIISLFHSLNMKVVAEGAETEDEINFLKQENCDIVQGFYYYKPMPIAEFTALIKAPPSKLIS